jgi:prepilin-type N-terminal cleavage/methylation domain-containing protein
LPTGEAGLDCASRLDEIKGKRKIKIEIKSRFKTNMHIDEHAMKIRTTRNAGFTLVEIMIVIAIIGMLAAAATTGITRALKTSKEQICKMNRDAVDNAKQLWMVENKKSDKDTPSEDDLKVYLKNNTFPSCPGGGTYTIYAGEQPTTCSVHAAPASP